MKTEKTVDLVVERPNAETPGGGPILTQQQYKQSCDVNVIVATYGRTGQMPNVNLNPPRYGDFSEAEDLMEAIQRVRDAEATFMQLPPKVREAAMNSPVHFLEMLADEGGCKALEAAGLKLRDRTEPAPEPKKEPAKEG